MPIGATIGAAGIQAASSIASNRSQASAARNAAATAERNTDQNNALQREIYYDQRGLYQPFYQSDLARRSALDEMFGINAIGQQQAGQTTGNAFSSIPGAGGSGFDPYGAYVSQNPDLQRAYDGLSTTNRDFVMRSGFDSDGDNRLSANEYGRFHYQNYGQGEGRALPSAPANQGGPQAANLPYDGKLPTQDTQGVTANGSQQGLFDSSIPGADRFNNSMFNPLAQTMFNTERDRIDSNLAASGMLYDGVRQTAVQDAGNRSAQNALSMYMNGLMGAPSSQAAGGMSNAANSYGANVQANNTMGANALMQSQQMQGQAQADMWGGIGQAAGFGLGAFNWGGKK